MSQTYTEIYNREYKKIKDFSEACETGNIIKAKYYNEKYNNVLAKEYNDLVFINTCINGHLEVCKWLYSFGNIDIHENCDAVFRLTCSRGKIDVAKWIYSFGNVDIHCEDEWAFRMACFNGHIDIVEWLYSLGNINIHSLDDFAFEVSCINKKIDICRWLIKHKANFIKYQNIIPYELVDIVFHNISDINKITDYGLKNKIIEYKKWRKTIFYIMKYRINDDIVYYLLDFV